MRYVRRNSCVWKECSTIWFAGSWMNCQSGWKISLNDQDAKMSLKSLKNLTPLPNKSHLSTLRAVNTDCFGKRTRPYFKYWKRKSSIARNKSKDELLWHPPAIASDTSLTSRSAARHQLAVYHASAAAPLAFVPSLLLVSQFEIYCLTICIIPLWGQISFGSTWKRICLVSALCRQRIRGVFLQVFALYKCKFTYLLPALLTLTIRLDIAAGWRHGGKVITNFTNFNDKLPNKVSFRSSNFTSESICNGYRKARRRLLSLWFNCWKGSLSSRFKNVLWQNSATSKILLTSCESNIHCCRTSKSLLFRIRCIA